MHGSNLGSGLVQGMARLVELCCQVLLFLVGLGQLVLQLPILLLVALQFKVCGFHLRIGLVQKGYLLLPAGGVRQCRDIMQKLTFTSQYNDYFTTIL